MKNLFKVRTLLLFLSLIPGVSLRAQAVYGSIVGTVTDPSGSAIVKATVTIADTGKGVNFDATTNDSGNYSQPTLSPASTKFTSLRPASKAIFRRM